MQNCEAFERPRKLEGLLKHEYMRNGMDFRDSAGPKVELQSYSVVKRADHPLR